MKTSSLAITALLVLLVLAIRDVQAQAYGPYYYGPYWDAIQHQQYQQYLQHQEYWQYLQQNDPYYELHMMHYQLYLQPYQPYQLYQPCCYAWGVIIPERLPPIRHRPRAAIGPREQTAVTPLPRAVSPLPRAVSPLPKSTRKR